MGYGNIRTGDELELASCPTDFEIYDKKGASYVPNNKAKPWSLRRGPSRSYSVTKVKSPTLMIVFNEHPGNHIATGTEPPATELWHTTAGQWRFLNLFVDGHVAFPKMYKDLLTTDEYTFDRNH